MKHSPLRLERHFFTKIHLDAQREGDLNAENTLESTVEVAQAEKNPRRFQVVLKLKLCAPADKKSTYVGEVHAVGFFRVVDKWPEAKISKLVETNGAALLYGTARELLCNLTARGPWPMVLLPSITFISPPEDEKKAGSVKPIKA